MRLAHILLPNASQYERKCQRADLAGLRREHDVVVVAADAAAAAGAAVAQLYGAGPIPASAVRSLRIPYVASGEVAARRWSLRRPSQPAFVVSPRFAKDATGRERFVPEPVEDRWFEAERPVRSPRSVRTVGSFRRPSADNLVEQTMSRISRFRDDVQWHLFDEPPTPEGMAQIDLWADPAFEEPDLDGFVAEALVLGVPVVASRFPVNELRLEQGRCGALVRPRDPNEWTHAILAALFKPEGTDPRVRAAQQTRSRFRAGHRLRVLTALYQTLTS